MITMSIDNRNNIASGQITANASLQSGVFKTEKVEQRGTSDKFISTVYVLPEHIAQSRSNFLSLLMAKGETSNDDVYLDSSVSKWATEAEKDVALFATENTTPDKVTTVEITTYKKPAGHVFITNDYLAVDNMVCIDSWVVRPSLQPDQVHNFVQTYNEDDWDTKLDLVTR